VTLRTRVGLTGGAAVLALTAVSLVLYPAVAANLHDQLDSSLVTTAAEGPDLAANLKQKNAASGGTTPVSDPLSVGTTVVQFVSAPVEAGDGLGFVPLTDRDLRVATGQDGAYFRDTTYRRQLFRVYTAAFPGDSGMLIRTGRPLSDQDATLHRVGLLLVVLTVAATVAAVLVARLVSGRVLRPVHTLTEQVERVTATGDLTARPAGTGRDEIGRLGRAFGTMMAAVDEAVRAQRRLVADASHELRTPLTSLTTNLELLGEPGGLTDGAASAQVRAALEQSTELTRLVNDLIELARYGGRPARTEDTRLDLLAAAVVERVTRRAPTPRFVTDLTPSLVHADPDAIERAIANLVDNAVLWSPPAGTVRVRVAAGTVSVVDDGPGIPAEDRPHVFDRFYRAPAARKLPGSGLGLAITRRIAEAHGGTVTVVDPTPPATTGAHLRLTLPEVVPEVLPGNDD
jgi:two-component system sensor histidine kinase MprB